MTSQSGYTEPWIHQFPAKWDFPTDGTPQSCRLSEDEGSHLMVINRGEIQAGRPSQGMKHPCLPSPGLTSAAEAATSMWLCAQLGKARGLNKIQRSEVVRKVFTNR